MKYANSTRSCESTGGKRIAASQKDEPGATLGMVRLMHDAGVKLLHLGANDFSTTSALPSSSAHYHGYCNSFMWKDEPADDKAVNATGGEVYELLTLLCSGYSKSWELNKQVPTMSAVLPGASDALVYLMQVCGMPSFL